MSGALPEDLKQRIREARAASDWSTLATIWEGVLEVAVTDNDAEWSVFWSRGALARHPPNSSKINTGKHVGEDASTARFDETIGFIVLADGTMFRLDLKHASLRMNAEQKDVFLGEV